MVAINSAYLQQEWFPFDWVELQKNGKKNAFI